MNEPVAWKYKVNKNNTKTEGICTDKHYLEKDGIYDIEPLYTHPAKTEDEGKVCARCGAIAYDPVITQTAKTLTDEEIMSEWEKSKDEVDFARAILRKAQEK